MKVISEVKIIDNSYFEIYDENGYYMGREINFLVEIKFSDSSIIQQNIKVPEVKSRHLQNKINNLSGKNGNIFDYIEQGFIGATSIPTQFA